MASRSKRVIYAALVGNLLVALTKFVAGGLTGSSAMASEAVHSLVEDRVRMVHPEIVLLLIKPQSGATLARTRRSADA
jgi:Cation efflux family